MPKQNFLLVDLNESKTKKLAETITSETSRKILNHLVDKEDSEANIAKSLNIAISTVHYHLQKLQEAGLVTVKEFHYSVKGREINHYKLANKYIIIAPKKVAGLSQKLRGILPVGLIVLGISAVLKFLTSNVGFTEMTVQSVPAKALMQESADMAMVAPKVISSSPDIAFWFFVGSMVTIFLYLIVEIVKSYLKN